MDAADGHGFPIMVSADVLEGLDAVAQSGETNMNNALEVQALGLLMGYPETVWWIERFPNVYVAGLIHGFVIESPPASE